MMNGNKSLQNTAGSVCQHFFVMAKAASSPHFLTPHVPLFSPSVLSLDILVISIDILTEFSEATSFWPSRIRLNKQTTFLNVDYSPLFRLPYSDIISST